MDPRRLKRYLGQMGHHTTPRRIANMLLVEAERVLRRTRLRGRPYQIIIDPTNSCQLRCPLCSTGVGENRRGRSVMDLELFKRVIDQLAPTALHVFMHNWGEPILLPNIDEYIAYVASANLGTTISSNLSMPLTEEKVTRIVASGLETLVVSCDGATAETYAVYRKGGEFSKVMENVGKVRAAREGLGQDRPLLEWQFLMFKHNEHEIDLARGTFKEHGFDSVVFGKPNLPFGCADRDLADKWFSSDPAHRIQQGLDIQDDILDGCYWPFRAVVINPNGGVSPCCYLADESTDFGNLADSSFDEIWNNDTFIAARALILGKGEREEGPACCARCHAVTGVTYDREDASR